MVKGRLCIEREIIGFKLSTMVSDVNPLLAEDAITVSEFIFHGIFFTGWNDGTFNEFQNKWDEQQVIPGGIIPGGGNNYDQETGGISCYTCDSCNKEPFDAEVYGVGTKSGCYMCVKAWDDGKWA